MLKMSAVANCSHPLVTAFLNIRKQKPLVIPGTKKQK